MNIKKILINYLLPAVFGGIFTILYNLSKFGTWNWIVVWGGFLFGFMVVLSSNIITFEILIPIFETILLIKNVKNKN